MNPVNEDHLSRLGKPLPKSVVILRALQLGDMLCAVPALRALRFALPKAHIALVGLPWAKSFMKRFSLYIDDFIEFPGYPGLPERKADVYRLPEFISRIQKERFDLVLQMQGNGSVVNPLVELFGAKESAGFYRKGEFCPDQDRFLAYPDREPEIRRHLRLMEFLGVPLKGEHLEFPITDQDREDLLAIKEVGDLLDQQYACVHPGSSVETRRWAPEKFAAVADSLYDNGLDVVITGSQAERELAQKVSRCMRAPHRNIAGRTSIGALAVLISQSRMIVCNDTGVSHMAEALRVPSVIVVTGSAPERWRPLDHERHRAVYHEVDCRPCSYLSCPFGSRCSNLVEPKEVIGQVQDLLSKEGYYAA